MDYEHQPTRGPAVWIGAGVLAVVGGAALLWVLRADSNDPVLVVAGWILVVTGIASATTGILRAIALRAKR